MILTALRLGKPVITANKALISPTAEELFAAARQPRRKPLLRSERRGGFPLSRPCREGFVGNRISHIYGIVNGTCNYILTRMNWSARLCPTLAEAQKDGLCRKPIRQWMWTVWTPCTRPASWPRWRMAFGSTRSAFRSRASAPSPGPTSSSADKIGLHHQIARVVKVFPARAGSGKERAKAAGGKAIQVSVYPALVPNSHVLASVKRCF